MRVWLTAALALICLAPLGAAAQDGSMEAAVLAEINWARAHPAEYAGILREYRSYFRGKLVQVPGDDVGVMTFEGARAVDEAIAYVERQRPMAPLGENQQLDQAAADYAAETGRAGVVGHVGPSGRTLMQRIRSAGVWPGLAGEDIAYGPETAEAVVRQLIIDDGVPSRGHRTAIFDPAYRVAGVGCGPHRVYRSMCVIDFAGALVER